MQKKKEKIGKLKKKVILEKKRKKKEKVSKKKKKWTVDYYRGTMISPYHLDIVNNSIPNKGFRII